MTSPWKLNLCIDACGHDDTHVRLSPLGPGRSPQVLVRTGTVLVHCLGPSAVMSAAEAWADARVRTSDWLPHEPQTPVAGSGASGVAVPTGSVIFDGRQPWSISTLGDGLTVTIGPLHVRVRDWTALDTHVRAWTEACDLAVRAFPGATLPFGRLVEHTRISSIQRAAGERPEPRPGLGRFRT